MKELEERILRDGELIGTEILKVDSFLNHQLDTGLITRIGEEFARLFAASGANKILTVEASGLPIAFAAAQAMGYLPMVFAKKSKTKNISSDVWSEEVESFTHGNTNTVIISKQYLGPEDKVLIIDDFLATGAALKGLKSLVEQAGGKVAGAGIAIEKVFQGGGDELRAEGMRIESLARIVRMTDDSIEFMQ